MSSCATNFELRVITAVSAPRPLNIPRHVFPVVFLATADVAYIHERLRKYTARAEAYSAAAGTRLQYLLLDMSPVTHLDTTGTVLRVLRVLAASAISLGTVVLAYFRNMGVLQVDMFTATDILSVVWIHHIEKKHTPLVACKCSNVGKDWICYAAHWGSRQQHLWLNTCCCRCNIAGEAA